MLFRYQFVNKLGSYATGLGSKNSGESMEFIAVYWWLWLFLVVVLGGAAMLLQVRNMKRVVEFKVDKGLFSGVMGVILLVIGANLAGLMFLISIVLNIIKFAKG